MERRISKVLRWPIEGMAAVSSLGKEPVSHLTLSNLYCMDVWMDIDHAKLETILMEPTLIIRIYGQQVIRNLQLISVRPAFVLKPKLAVNGHTAYTCPLGRPWNNMSRVVYMNTYMVRRLPEPILFDSGR